MSAALAPQSTGIHHIAFGTKCTQATYQFYHERLGMTLARVENHRKGKGYFKHFFFDMGGGQYMAFFEMNNVGEKPDFRTDINLAVGVPMWINHIAFKAPTEAVYEEIKARCKQNAVPLLAEVDHDWCKSVYLIDPNGLMLEFTYNHNPAGFRQDPAEALRLLNQSGEEIAEDTRKTKVSTSV
jgi:glyoxylase I family protein